MGAWFNAVMWIFKRGLNILTSRSSQCKSFFSIRTFLRGKSQMERLERGDKKKTWGVPLEQFGLIFLLRHHVKTLPQFLSIFLWRWSLECLRISLRAENWPKTRGLVSWWAPSPWFCRRWFETKQCFNFSSLSLLGGSPFQRWLPVPGSELRGDLFQQSNHPQHYV